ncbi:DNA alkylation repair protein [Clostridiaceae bacterium HSG29]|nr:DNA alkylation repair protein [Clostridiaceae bacterium HSG29]
MKKYNNEKYLNELADCFKTKENDEIAKQMKKYMRNQFDFHGIKTTERRKITKSFLKENNRPPYGEIHEVIKKLWNEDNREKQYFAQELVLKYKKEWDESIIELFEYMVINKSWWDTVDIIAKKLIGEYFLKYPQNLMFYYEKWVISDNIWLNRVTLIYQLGYKELTNEKNLFNAIEQLKVKNEFFIQKAIGWSLREYSKVKPKVINEYIINNELSNLATKEGLKWMKNNDLL